jgi:hypothetical protein
MPKHSYRCNRRFSGQLPSVATVAFSAPPRKVSFEDGHSDSDSSLSGGGSSSSSSSVVHLQHPHRDPRRDPRRVSVSVSHPSPLRRPKAPTLLRRPKSSLSLVELAQGVDDENDENEQNKHHQQDENESMFASPVSKPLDMMQVSSSPLSAPSSPWGYFVEMVPSSVDAAREPTATDTATPSSAASPSLPHLINHDGPCSCCTSSSRRRASPYGNYKKQQQQRRSSLCFHNNNSNNNGRSIPLPSSLRLTPRNQPSQEPADQLAGAMTHLHVMDS